MAIATQHPTPADESSERGLVPYTHSSTIYPAAARTVPAYGGMVLPVATPGEVRDAITAFEEMKAALAQTEDMILYSGRIFLRKSFWRRAARAFGLNVELVSEDRRVDPDGAIAYSVIYRAIAPNGALMDGDGFCSTAELRAPTNTEHNARARAHTRAKNRAISDLIGGGQVSADELTDEQMDEVRRNTDGKNAPAPRPTPAAPARRVSPVEPPAPAQTFDERVMKASRSQEILSLLRDLGISDTTKQREQLDEIFQRFDANKRVMQKGDLKAALEAKIARKRQDEEAAMDDDMDASGEASWPAGEPAPTPAASDEIEFDLSELDTGMPGN